jgi:hypothetical protein
MADKRKIEIFSAGCALCKDLIEQVKAAACPSCEISVLDIAAPGVAERARQLGVFSLPAVAIDGLLADCCAGRGPDLAALKTAGLGRAIG